MNQHDNAGAKQASVQLSWFSSFEASLFCFFFLHIIKLTLMLEANNSSLVD